MDAVRQVFGFYLRDKAAALAARLTWAYALAGLFVLGLAAPALGFLLYPSLVFLAWASLTGRVTRSGLFFFWLPFFAVVGFAVWLPVFPSYLGIVLAVLLLFLVSNLFFLLLSSSRGNQLLLLPMAFFLLEFAFHSLPAISHVELPLRLGLVADHLPVIRLVGLLALANTVAAPSIRGDGTGVRIAAVQGSARQATHGHYLGAVRDGYFELVAGVDADIVLFPEVPIAIYYPAQEEYNGQIFVDLARAKDALVVPLVSEYRLAPNGTQERYITSLVASPDGIIGATSKRNLVPFSESRRITPGRDYSPIATEFGLVGIAICYDFNAPHIIRRLKANGSEVILAPFNDAGFGAVFHRMHSHYSILRALEYNVPIIVANEDGISQIVDCDGRVHAALGIGERGVIAAWVAMEDRPSYYMLFGRWAEYALLAAMAVVIGTKAKPS